MRGLSLAAASGGYCLIVVLRLLIVVASLIVEHGLQGSVAVVRGLTVWLMKSSWSRDQTLVPCIGRRFLIHCATREILTHLHVPHILLQ